MPATRPVMAMAATRSIAITTIPRKTGCARPTPQRGIGIRSRSTPAKSKGLMTRWRRCCLSLPKKAAEERPLSPRYCPDIAAVRRARGMRGGCGCLATALRYESGKDFRVPTSRVGKFWECRTGNAVHEDEEVPVGHRSCWPGIRPDVRRRPCRPALHQSPRTRRRLRLDRLLHRRQRRRRAWPRSPAARLAQYGVALFDLHVAAGRIRRGSNRLQLADRFGIRADRFRRRGGYSGWRPER